MKLRRYPHLSEGDLELLRALPPGDARKLERTIRSQYDSDRRFSKHNVLEAGLPAGGLERILAPRSASSHGLGGGRRRNADAPCG